MEKEILNNAPDETVDITKYPEGPMEIVKHMGYLPVNNDERMKDVMAYLANVLGY